MSPSVDEKAAREQHEEACKAWRARYETEHENGRTSAEALQDRAGDKLSDAIEKLINTRATTIEGLRCKARLVKMMDSQDHEIMLSLVDDLTEVQS